jgi:hypothetical protein
MAALLPQGTLLILGLGRVGQYPSAASDTAPKPPLTRLFAIARHLKDVASPRARKHDVPSYSPRVKRSAWYATMG